MGLRQGWAETTHRGLGDAKVLSRDLLLHQE